MIVRYGIRPATLADLPCLRVWMEEAHVRRWWKDGDPFAAGDLHTPDFRPWIISLNCRPFAYIQDYAVHAQPGHPLANTPPGARGIDQFIGPADMIGQGHGPAFIAQHMATLFAEDAPVIVTDPHPENARAIAALTKAGFHANGPARDGPWGQLLPMMANRP